MKMSTSPIPRKLIMSYPSGKEVLMETYSYDNNMLILIDDELSLSIQLPFTPTMLPDKPNEDQRIENQWVVQTVRNEEGVLEQAYLEKDSIIDGQCLFYYPSGKPKMELFYLNSTLHGPTTFYSEEGNILARRWFVHGKKQGKSWWYYPSGALYSLQRFKDDVWHGKQEYFYQDGSPKTIMQYNQGELDKNVQLFRKN